MNDPFSALRHRLDALAARIRAAPHAEWGVITQASPLRVRLDGDAEPLLGTPSTLVSGLRVGDRVQAMIQNRKVTIIGRGGGDQLPENKTLWSHSTGYYMSGSQTATLNELVSEQRTGIVLVWSAYSSGSPDNWSYHQQFIPKKHVTDFTGFSTQPLGSAGAIKNVYVRNDRIDGRAGNESSPNNTFVLRAVYGV